MFIIKCLVHSRVFVVIHKVHAEGVTYQSYKKPTSWIRLITVANTLRASICCRKLKVQSWSWCVGRFHLWPAALAPRSLLASSTHSQDLTQLKNYPEINQCNILSESHKYSVVCSSLKSHLNSVVHTRHVCNKYQIQYLTVLTWIRFEISLTK